MNLKPNNKEIFLWILTQSDSMKINQYTVVSCNNCEEVWIVEDKPESSQCPTCEKTRRFKLLKKYKSVDNIEEARVIRAKVKATLADSDEEFEEALEEDKILAGGDTFSTGTQFTSSSKSRSFEDVVEEAIESFNDIEEIENYCEEHGYDGERANEYVEKKKQQGEVLEQDGEIRFI